MMAELLREQLRLYESQAEKVEQWKIDHQAAMECRELEHALRLGLSTLEGIRRDNASWAEAIERGTRQHSWEDAKQIAQLYSCWLAVGQDLLPCIDFYEREGFVVEGADAFRTACREISLMSLDVERVRDNIKALEAGRGVSHDQAMYALRHSVC